MLLIWSHIWPFQDQKPSHIMYAIKKHRRRGPWWFPFLFLFPSFRNWKESRNLQPVTTAGRGGQLPVQQLYLFLVSPEKKDQSHAVFEPSALRGNPFFDTTCETGALLLILSILFRPLSHSILFSPSVHRQNDHSPSLSPHFPPRLETFSQAVFIVSSFRESLHYSEK